MKVGTIGMQMDSLTPKGATNHIYSNMLPFGKTNRTLVFISQSARNRSIRSKANHRRRLHAPKTLPQ